ncbi:MAG TPA: S46 family peptidase [Pyrinomonadaceae bacterium]
MQTNLNRRVLVLFLLYCFLCAPWLSAARADEGMWTFANPPLRQLKEKYNFEPTKEWLDHVRLSSVRVGGGTGSFVSASGLVLTNHHIVRSSLAKLSTQERDLLKTGFYATTRAEELKASDLVVEVLVSMEDVTERVLRVGRGVDDRDAEARRKAEVALVEKEAREKTSGLRPTVISLYEGGEYWLYNYKRYTDVRIVFAPEAQAAEFGGDYDNFTFPRYALDCAFVRVYENDKPAQVQDYLRWNSKGATENELIFVVGNPGSTDRLRTISQIEYQRDMSNPMQLRSFTRRRDALVRFSARGAEQARRASDTISGLNNTLKRLQGQQEGLLTDKLMQQKQAEERSLRERLAQNQEWQKTYGGAWDEMAAVYKKLTPMAKRLFYSSLSGSTLAGYALAFAQYAAEIKKPSAERLAPYRDSNLESLKTQLLSPAPVYMDYEEFVLAERLKEIQEELGANDPFVKAAVGGRAPVDAAGELIKGTKLNDLTYRKSLLEGGAAAIDASTDALIVLARQLDPIVRELDKWNRENIEGARNSAGERVAKARFAIYGRSIAPDANFTLRFAYGVVKGYELGTTLVPYKTTYAGLYDRGASFEQKPPFNIAPQLLARRQSVELTTPFDFVYTADTIGGNSGSPVINRQGEIVGVNFDSNVHRFVSRYVYTEETGRAMGVHTGGIIEALRRIYNALPLADELERNANS